ncbi:gamma-tubulin complex component [Niveomyces insectorum RCEF 264]|uniref:Spindle pole body component n=1 Tax=Niveomyces insectorum RCEF 264 TaxID=1081102 RepID=A0A167U068_9HYPO|nr:gamma-tubulin complex component [Niveomyces insectorum RCEF 264]
MAFLAQLSTQTEELVTAITSTSPKTDPEAFGALREATLRSLRYHNFGRTNQFEVKSRLDGLEERFSVAGRDGLAGALRLRRAALRLPEHMTKWTPDILEFLLELSDRPVEKASPDALNQLCASKLSPVLPALRWEDIAKEDGWADERALWENTYYGGPSDDGYDDDGDGDGEYDNELDKESNGNADDTSLSSVDTQEQHQTRPARIAASAQARSSDDLALLLQAVHDSQAWRTQHPREIPASGSAGAAVGISEPQMLRETLFMLHGLDTTLFGCDCAPREIYRLSDVSAETHKSLIAAVAASGRKLLPLRRWVDSNRHPPESVPLLQVFRDAIRRRLQTWDQQLSEVEARFVHIQQDVIVSLVAVLDELQPSLACLYALAAIVQQLDAERNAHVFRYLELLFDAAARAQLEGNQLLYEFLGTAFFDCFSVYLRPIRLWMEEGKLLDADKGFFVASTPTQAPLNHIWRDQFKLLQTSSGVLHAPKFLQPAASRIFTTGKSIVVLKRLGKYDARTRRTPAHAAAAGTTSDALCSVPEPTLDYATVCAHGLDLVPFAQLFADAFERWIQSKHHAASATLQATLFGACGLWTSLQALHHIYLMVDGAMVDAFASRVFHNLDTESTRWHDRYTITEFAREAFGPCLDAYRLTATVDEGSGAAADNDEGRGQARDAFLRNALARIRLLYQLAWPVQIVISADSIAGYQALFTFLLQIRWASSLLSRHRLLGDDNDVRGATAGPAAALPAATRATTTTTGEMQQRRLPAGDRALYFALRAKLLWFCNTLQSYLAALVIAPRIAALSVDLQRAADIDAMIAVHAAFVKALVAEACLGPKLQPIHDGMLDLLDLVLRLQDAHRVNAKREASELQEIWRLSVLSSSPYQTPSKHPVFAAPTGSGAVRRKLFSATPMHRDNEDGEDEGSKDDAEHHNDEHDDDYDAMGSGSQDIGDSPPVFTPFFALKSTKNTQRQGQTRNAVATDAGRRYGDVLQSISIECSNCLRFVTGGLRGVARASNDTTAAAKWDMLAEMLEDGSERRGVRG